MCSPTNSIIIHKYKQHLLKIHKLITYLDATSVAKRIDRSLALNLFKAPRRLF